MIINNNLPFAPYTPIIRQPVLTGVSVMSSEPNWKAYSHIHSESVELILAARGNGYVHINGKTHPFGDGDIFVVNPGLEHYEDFTCSEESCLLYICQFSMLQIYKLPPGEILPLGIPEVIKVGSLRDALIRSFTVLYEESCSQSFGYEQIVYARLESLILYLYRLYEAYLPRDFFADTDERNIAIAAKSFIDQHLHTGIRLEDISAAVAVSDYYLTHVFTAYYHISPIHYLIRRRLNESMQMLITSSLSVKEIAYRTGFENLSNFNNHFLKHIGVSPTQFRKNEIDKTENPNEWTIYIH